jgi:hypothetical protein
MKVFFITKQKYFVFNYLIAIKTLFIKHFVKDKEIVLNRNKQ